MHLCRGWHRTLHGAGGKQAWEGEIAGGIWECKELGFLQPDGFNHIEPGLDRVAATCKCWGRPGRVAPSPAAKFHGIRATGTLGSLVGAQTKVQQQGRACYWGRERRSATLWQHGKSIPFFISTAEYYYALCMAFMNVCLTIIYLPEINSLLSLQTSNQCHHLFSLQIN